MLELMFVLFLFSTKINLSHIFKKREAAAVVGLGIETQRSKRARIEEVPSLEGRVPTHKPVAIGEDPAPFKVGWGLRKMDTVLGDSRATTEWSMSVITHWDQTHVVESSDDLQIELLGDQVLASVTVLEPLLYFLYLFYTLSSTHLWYTI